MSRTHTIFPGYVPVDFFSEENIRFVLQKSIQVLNGEFFQEIHFERPGVIRVMDRVVNERLESVPKMNQRVVMYLTNEFRNYQAEVNKHLNWQENYVHSQRLYDPVADKSHFDMMGHKSLMPGFNEPRRQGLAGQAFRFTFI